MILQALKEYYDRKEDLPRQGFEEKEIPYIVVLDKNGNVVNLESTYEGTGKEKRAKLFLLPKSVKRASGVAANLLWDNPEYALGIKIKSDKERISKMHGAFIEKINSLGDIDDKGLNALKLFLKNTDKEELLNKSNVEIFKELKEDKKAYITFKLAGEDDIISKTPNIMRTVGDLANSDEGEKSVCLITGERDTIVPIHNNIKGFNATGANIVSFQINSGYDSYGKEQGHNAPCGERGMFAYTTALNSLLAKDSAQRMLAGDATMVFWASKPDKLESNFASLFSIAPKDNPDVGINAVRALFKSVESGTGVPASDDKKFYVLGLSPNKARISVRFFIKDTVAGMSTNIARYFEDLKVDRPAFENEFLPLFKLLLSTAAFGKSENIAPHLAGDFMMSVLRGLPYPNTLLQALIIRIKAEQKINYPRAALIKAYLNRNEKEGIKVSLDIENANQGYVLGRLFAALEKLQEEAHGSTNSTIIRYYGSASSTPVTVFANLMRLHQHHLSKLGKEKPGREIYFGKLIGEIHSRLDNKTGYPAHLPLAEQGMFAIGYYQQRQDFFKTKEEKANKGE
ncbi:MAG: type I-C CRISPR-associated protein Cas8c/Csd1 [Syntrophomonadaceae bacterium]|jgi:CRISPR-associated protein Csd1|nr:type I-C CRISPR-associated protein Cas8c/Csd1 [Syntrophomonadaceae bacterium]